MLDTLLGKYRHWLAFKVINIGISLLPKHLQNRTLIENCMKTGHIKLANSKKVEA